MGEVFEVNDILEQKQEQIGCRARSKCFCKDASKLSLPTKSFSVVLFGSRCRIYSDAQLFIVQY